MLIRFACDLVTVQSIIDQNALHVMKGVFLTYSDESKNKSTSDAKLPDWKQIKMQKLKSTFVACGSPNAKKVWKITSKDFFTSLEEKMPVAA